VSSRTRPPEFDLEWEEPTTRPPRPAPRRRRRTPSPPRGGAGARRFGLPIVGAALFIGLVVGYLVSSGSHGTTTVTETKTVTAPAATPAPAAASGPASRAGIALVVLNGSDESGLAGRTGDQARSMGYEEVTEGNAPVPETRDRVLYRAGYAAEARQVSDDLGLGDPVRLTPTDPISDAVDSSAQVVVALGPPLGATGGAAAGGATDADATGAGATGADATGTGADETGTPADAGAATPEG
jgi:hypothetical protein